MRLHKEPEATRLAHALTIMIIPTKFPQITSIVAPRRREMNYLLGGDHNNLKSELDGEVAREEEGRRRQEEDPLSKVKGERGDKKSWSGREILLRVWRVPVSYWKGSLSSDWHAFQTPVAFVYGAVGRRPGQPQVLLPATQPPVPIPTSTCTVTLPQSPYARNNDASDRNKTTCTLQVHLPTMVLEAYWPYRVPGAIGGFELQESLLWQAILQQYSSKDSADCAAKTIRVMYNFLPSYAQQLSLNG